MGLVVKVILKTEEIWEKGTPGRAKFKVGSWVSIGGPLQAGVSRIGV